MITDEVKQDCAEVVEAAQLVRLPLWKACAEAMLAEGVDFGKVYPAEYFEERLRCKRDDMKFGFDMSEIRRVLETKGFYLSGRGGKGDSFVIVEANKNANVMKNYQASAFDCIKRGVILGMSTPLDKLTDSERIRHEGALERMQLRLSLMRKPKEFAKAASKGLKLNEARQLTEK